jgi:hypothetical protein
MKYYLIEPVKDAPRKDFLGRDLVVEQLVVEQLVAERDPEEKLPAPDLKEGEREPERLVRVAVEGIVVEADDGDGAGLARALATLAGMSG